MLDSVDWSGALDCFQFIVHADSSVLDDGTSTRPVVELCVLPALDPQWLLPDLIISAYACFPLVDAVTIYCHILWC